MTKRLCLFFLALSLSAQAQDTTAVFDASGFGDADETPVKRFCSQKIMGQSPTKLVSVAFDYQGPSDLQMNELGGVAVSGPKEKLTAIYGPRIAYSTPVISRSNIILNLGINYWGTGYTSSDKGGAAERLKDRWFHSLGVNATVFKPLDEKHFIIAQVQADHNTQGTDFDSKALTFSGTALYGWKPNERLMWGVGATRTYRLGAVIYLPVLYYYQTFNRKWGVEAVLPARAHVRYNLDKRSYLMGGYEAEGNQYFLGNSGNAIGYSNNFLRRGEIRPRIIYERSLSGFFWISAQAGVRVNGRFAIADKQNADRDNNLVKFDLSPAPYAQIGISLVSP